MLSALVSIHDVMPETLPQVCDMLNQLQRLERLPATRITLLVVAGKEWKPQEIRWLQCLAGKGHPLAGHGWSHQAPAPRSLYHALHSVLLSRQAAEHLSRCEPELKSRVQDCYDWFQQHDLPAPELYVPPAWANGNLQWLTWQERPFRMLETLNAVVDLDTNTQHSLSLTGYEADTTLRAIFLNFFNQFNLQRARSQQQPVRIGLHPNDLKLALASQAFQHLAEVTEFRCYSSLN